MTCALYSKSPGVILKALCDEQTKIEAVIH